MSTLRCHGVPPLPQTMVENNTLGQRLFGLKSLWSIATDLGHIFWLIQSICLRCQVLHPVSKAKEMSLKVLHVCLFVLKICLLMPFSCLQICYKKSRESTFPSHQLANLTLDHTFVSKRRNFIVLRFSLDLAFKGCFWRWRGPNQMSKERTPRILST